MTPERIAELREQYRDCKEGPVWECLDEIMDLENVVKENAKLLLPKEGEYSNGNGREVTIPVNRWKRICVASCNLQDFLKEDNHG